VLSTFYFLLIISNNRRRHSMKRSLIILVCMTFVLAALPVMAQGPKNMGGKSGTWQETSDGSDVYVHTKKSNHWKAWNAPGGKMFTQPGKAEGKANSRSVVGDFPPHSGTQLRPGSNRR
jgi:hypothetical protein